MANAAEEILLHRSSSAGGRRYIGSYMYMHGMTDQYALGGPFRGRQCTSIALAALISWRQKGRPGLLTPADINAILIEGDRLHSRLRLEHNLSAECDGMIAIYDIPSQWYLDVGEVFNMPTRVRLARESYPVFTTRMHELDFPTIGEFVLTFLPRMPMGFLATIDCYTYAIIRRVDNSVLLFDSHGHLQVKGRILEKAGFLLCPTVYSMEEILVGLYGNMAQCDIAPIDIDLPDDGLKRIQEPPGVEEQSPYISAFWGRDD